MLGHWLLYQESEKAHVPLGRLESLGISGEKRAGLQPGGGENVVRYLHSFLDLRTDRLRLPAQRPDHLRTALHGGHGPDALVLS